MSHNARVLLVTAVVGVVLVGIVVAYQWIGRPATIEISAQDAPGPVILIPGYGGGAGGLSGLAGYLQSQGRQVVIADIGDGRGDIGQYGRQVGALASTLTAQGSPSVDLVGYSMGGLVARSAAEANPGAVRRVATVASPHEGTSIAGLGAFLGNASACPTACQQMAPGSDFLEALPVAGDPSRWLSAWSEGDDVVRPPEAATLTGATNVDVTADCAVGTPDHGGVIRTPTVWSLVADFLATGAITPACR
ncbi:MAG: lipase [Actinomycetales bacterium]|nr:lipase [Actinomycetales bacterium]